MTSFNQDSTSIYFAQSENYYKKEDDKISLYLINYSLMYLAFYFNLINDFGLINNLILVSCNQT